MELEFTWSIQCVQLIVFYMFPDGDKRNVFVSKHHAVFFEREITGPYRWHEAASSGTRAGL